MTKVASILFAGALMASAAPQTFTGVVTDTMCGRDHAMMKVSPDAKCVVECVKGDKNTKYALFDGKNLDEWVSAQDKSPARWTVADGAMTVKKVPGLGNIETKRTFKNYQLHLEWKIPENITGSGQARGNSGVFLASTGPGDDIHQVVCAVRQVHLRPSRAIGGDGEYRAPK